MLLHSVFHEGEVMATSNNSEESAQTFPQLRIWLCGPFRMAWIDPTSGAELPPSDSSTGGRDWAAAISLLALLLCQPNRQAHRDWVMEQFWPEGTRSVALHRLETIFSCLRKLLRPPSGGESLLRSIIGKKTSGPSYCLNTYPRLWSDLDALTWQIEQAARMERFGDDALPIWQRAFDLLKRGPFLADAPYDPYAVWIKEQRTRVEGAGRQCVHALSRLYLAKYGDAGKAEALLLLRTYWQQHKTDEDALRPLLELLGEQERYQEAEEYYRHLVVALADLGPDEEGQSHVPDARTRDIAEYLRTKQIRRTQKIQHPFITISSTLPIDPHLPVPSTSLQESPVEIDLFNIGIMALILHQQQSGWNSNELEQRVTQALDSMIPEIQKTHRLSRRGILSLIVGMPLALHGFATISRQSAPSLVPEEVIPLYAAGIPACWRLYYEGGQIQLEQVLPYYLSHLTLLTENPSKLQKTAAGLLSQTYQLMALLSQGHEPFEEAIEYCQQAAFYGHYAEDTNLQVMAYIRLQDTYWEHRAFDKCFLTLKQAELFAEKASPLLRGRIFARLANAYSYRSELTSAQHYIDVAQQVFPQHPEMDAGFLYSHTTHFVLYANEVSTRIKMGQPQRAWDAIVNAEKYVLGPTNPRKMDVTQYQIQVAIALGDLEQCSALFEKLIHLVKLLGHELDKRNTYTLYHALCDRWPHEERVKKMKQLLS
jgi:DNA-binding SARP family transcriptional activator/tetratricopeptide (TPR) repeat protein